MNWTHISQARVFLFDTNKIDMSGVDDGVGITAIQVVGRCVKGGISRDGCVLDTEVLEITGQLFFIECDCYDALDCTVQISVAG